MFACYGPSVSLKCREGDKNKQALVSSKHLLIFKRNLDKLLFEKTSTTIIDVTSSPPTPTQNYDVFTFLTSQFLHWLHCHQMNSVLMVKISHCYSSPPPFSENLQNYSEKTRDRWLQNILLFAHSLLFKKNENFQFLLKEKKKNVSFYLTQVGVRAKLTFVSFFLLSFSMNLSL